MNNESSFDVGPDEQRKLLERRLFLQSMGKWSGAAIAAAVFGSVWFAGPPAAEAGWINRRGGGKRRMDQWPGWLGRRGQLGEWWWRRLGQSPELWWRRIMDQPLVGDSTGHIACRTKSIDLSGSAIVLGYF